MKDRRKKGSSVGEVGREEEKERDRNTRRPNDSKALGNEQNVSISMHELTTG